MFPQKENINFKRLWIEGVYELPAAHGRRAICYSESLVTLCHPKNVTMSFCESKLYKNYVIHAHSVCLRVSQANLAAEGPLFIFWFNVFASGRSPPRFFVTFHFNREIQWPVPWRTDDPFRDSIWFDFLNRVFRWVKWVVRCSAVVATLMPFLPGKTLLLLYRNRNLFWCFLITAFFNCLFIGRKGT